LKSAQPINSNLNRINYNQAGLNYDYQNPNPNISSPSINSSLQTNNLNGINSVKTLEPILGLLLIIFLLKLLIQKNIFKN